MSDANKVRFGLSKVHYATMQSDGTYDTPVPIKGAVNISLSPEGSSSTFYADNNPYFVLDSNSGYTGDLEIAYLTDEARIELLNEVKAGNGIVYEDSDRQPAKVALMFEFDGDANAVRHVLYNVTFSRPELSGETNTESIEPQTTTLSYTAIPAQVTIGTEVKNVTKGSLPNTTETKVVYDKWYTDVQTPSAAV